MSDTTALLTTLHAAKGAAATLTTAERDMRRRHEELTRERDRTEGLLQPMDEVIANMQQAVEAHRRRFDERRQSVVAAFSSRMELSRQDNEFHRKRPTGRFLEGPLDFDVLCGLVPDLVKVRLEEMIRATPVNVFGLSSGERKERIAALDAEVADVEKQHTELVDAAAEVGIALPLLEAVQQRRDEEKRQRQRENELQRQRAALGVSNALTQPR